MSSSVLQNPQNHLFIFLRTSKCIVTVTPFRGNDLLYLSRENSFCLKSSLFTLGPPEGRLRIESVRLDTHEIVSDWNDCVIWTSVRVYPALYLP